MATTIRISAIRPSLCCPCTLALDADVAIDLGDVTLEGEVTLLPAEYDGRYASWGSPDMWVSGNLLAALRGMDSGRYNALLDELSNCAGDACDNWRATN